MLRGPRTTEGWQHATAHGAAVGAGVPVPGSPDYVRTAKRALQNKGLDGCVAPSCPLEWTVKCTRACCSGV